jgi:hypothetical protein
MPFDLGHDTAFLIPGAPVSGHSNREIPTVPIGCPLSPRKRTSGRRSRADCGPMTERVDLGGFGSVKSPRVSALHVQAAGEDQQIKLVACPGFEPAGIKSPNQPLIGTAFGGRTCKVCTSHGPTWKLLHRGATLGAAAGREIRRFPPLLGSDLPFH